MCVTTRKEGEYYEKQVPDFNAGIGDVRIRSDGERVCSSTGSQNRFEQSQEHFQEEKEEHEKEEYEQFEE